ncbi:hypothetical protein NRP93_001120 [Clostridium botulinum]|nr:hypothetical protein [Clostridium botulinum]
MPEDLSKIGIKINFQNEIPRIEEEWNEFLSEKYGPENVTWETKGAADPKKVKYYRVQSEGKSGSFERLKVNEDGTISVLTDNSNMNLSAVTDEHAQYFLNEVRKGEGYIIEFEVDDWFHEMVMENAIPQAGYRKSVLNQGKTAPKIVAPTKPRPNATSISFEFPPIWNDFFEEAVHNAKILKN